MSKAPPSVESSEAYPPMQDIYYIQGYLYKKTRDGRWQKRWFETTGCFLTYYKSKKMTKLLAALNLPQVGEIKLVTDPAGEDAEDKGKLFSIHLNDRDYLLKAVDAAAPRMASIFGSCMLDTLAAPFVSASFEGWEVTSLRLGEGRKGHYWVEDDKLGDYEFEVFWA